MHEQKRDVGLLALIVNLGWQELYRRQGLMYEQQLNLPVTDLRRLMRACESIGQGVGLAYEPVFGNIYVQALRYIDGVISGAVRLQSFESLAIPIELAKYFTIHNLHRGDIGDYLTQALNELDLKLILLEAFAGDATIQPQVPLVWDSETGWEYSNSGGIRTAITMDDLSEYHNRLLDLQALKKNVLLPIVAMCAELANHGDLPLVNATAGAFICEGCGMIRVDAERHRSTNACQECVKEADEAEVVRAKEDEDADDGFYGHYAGSDWE